MSKLHFLFLLFCILLVHIITVLFLIIIYSFFLCMMIPIDISHTFHILHRRPRRDILNKCHPSLCIICIYH